MTSSYDVTDSLQVEAVYLGSAGIRYHNRRAFRNRGKRIWKDIRRSYEWTGPESLFQIIRQPSMNIAVAAGQFQLLRQLRISSRLRGTRP